MKKYKVVFCGTPKIGAVILERLISMENVDVQMVITQPDRPVGRKKVLTPSAVKEVALNNNIEVIQPEKVGEAFDKILDISPDFMITCAYGQFIPSKILAIPTIDAINIHGSLLPKYRGGAPIQYAIRNGDKETGISIMKMVKKMDAGDYFVQEKLAIDIDDNCETLFAKMAILGADMIEKYLEPIASGQLQPIAQNEDEVTFSLNISTEQEMIDWNKSAEEIHNLVRSLAPSPISHTFINGERYKIGKTRLLSSDNPQDIFPSTNMIHKVGKILRIDESGIVVQTGAGMIRILEIQRTGKTMVDASMYKKNNLQDLKEGMFFEN